MLLHLGGALLFDGEEPLAFQTIMQLLHNLPDEATAACSSISNPSRTYLKPPCRIGRSIAPGLTASRTSALHWGSTGIFPVI